LIEEARDFVFTRVCHGGGPAVSINPGAPVAAIPAAGLDHVYDGKRIHPLGYLTPAEFEQRWFRRQKPTALR
jgi:hypothetical protein